ncbi:reductase [Lithospermum erythrorhizon]|uniref:Reductase n=1 Tax=Lithospermum erythrorhizon TaxID=34254 RepID=A0AAV3NWB8_LITER
MGTKTEVANHLEPWHELTGKVVMVTGASAGLGRGFCLDLARAGCLIIAAARRVHKLESLCEEINNKSSSNGSPRAVAVALDVSATGKVIEQGVNKAWEAFGRIDALVNNAGVRGRVHTPLDLTEEEFDEAYKTNLRGTWLVTKYVSILMRDSKQGGSVINIASISGLNRGELPGALAYSATKAGVNTMTKMMGVELGVYKIRVNSISPGLFKSEITAGLMQRDFVDTVAKKTAPMGTYGTSDPALTSLVRYLIHGSSEYISGNVYIVDAGATLPGFPIWSSL